jgi:zinc protease
MDEVKRELAARMVARRLDILTKQKDSPLLAGQVQIQPFLRLVQFAQLEVTAPPPRWADAVAVAARELRQVRKFGFSQSEFAQARAELQAELETAAKSAPTRKSRDLADEIVSTLAAGRVFITPAEALDIAMTSIEARDCHEAFEEAFGSKDLTVFAAGNLPPMPNGETLEAALQRGMNEPIHPPDEGAGLVFGYSDFGPAGEIAERKEIPDLGITQLVFRNGVRANLKPTDFKKDEVLVQVSFGAGKLSIPKDQPGLELYTRSTFQLGGLGKNSVDDLRTVLAGRTVSADFDVGEDAFAFAGTTTRKDFRTQLELLCAYLVDPGWREEADRLFRQSAEAMFAQVEHTLEGQMQAQVAPFLRGGDHRFAFPTRDEALARTVDEARAWLGPALEKGPVEVGMVGDFDLETGIEAVAATFGAIGARSTDPVPKPGPLNFPPPGRQEMSYQTKIAKAAVLAHFPTTDRSDIQRTRRLQVLASVFGDELREKIREELGESYSPRATATASDVFPGYGSMYASVLVAPSQAGKVSASVVEIARKLAGEGIDPDAVDRALKPLLTAIDEQRRSNAYWLTTVCAACQRDPRRIEWARTMVDDFKAVTAGDLIPLAKQYLDPAALREIRVLPVE